jgi:predicted helicase
LNREEWKFLRLAQHLCITSQTGIIGVIINRDFLDGIAKRKMREDLGVAFPYRVVVDLNGDTKGNISDENVFDIEQGVAISILSTKHNNPGFFYTSRVGTRIQKQSDLSNYMPIFNDLMKTTVTTPYFRWMAESSVTQQILNKEYENWIPLNEVFENLSSGIETKNDGFCIAQDDEILWERIKQFASISSDEARNKFSLLSEGNWSVEVAQKEIRDLGLSKNRIRQILYRPFDWRFIYYTRRSGGFLGRPRYEVMRHMLHKNIALIFNRQSIGDTCSYFGVTRNLMIKGTFYLGNKGNDYLAPLYLADEFVEDGSKKHTSTTNLTGKYILLMNKLTANNLEKTSPEQFFVYIYSVMYSQQYRSRYSDSIRIDFPRIPLPGGPEIFHALVPLGEQLVALHLMESPLLDTPNTRTVGSNWTVSKVGYADGTVWIDGKGTKTAYLRGTTGFAGVPEEVWNFHIGGYQVCEKWLKDRKGRVLSAEDITHYQKIVVALQQTIRLMAEIDVVIDAHGGWPGAFASGVETSSEPVKAQFGQTTSSGTPKRRAAEESLPLNFADDE